MAAQVGEVSLGDRGPGHERDTAAVEAAGVTKIFDSAGDRVVALDDVSVSINENEFFTLLGPSGCGKTTLLRLIAGFEHPSKGEILLGGSPISHLPPYRRPVNTVFQNYALFPHMTVAENIGFGLEMLGKTKAEAKDTARAMLALVRMEELAERRTSQLSGGQQQRVALARGLAPHPRVLLLDEPLSALDLKLRKEMQIELKRLQNETGITFVFVTHDQEEALTMSDRVAVMDQGKILQIGGPREVYDHPADHFVAHFIGETNFLEAELLELQGSRATVRLHSGAVVEASAPAGNLAPGKVNLVLRPEHATLTTETGGAAPLGGRIENVVYFGTDTHFHLTLDNGRRFIVRQQNLRDASNEFSVNQDVGILIKGNAFQVLLD